MDDSQGVAGNHDRIRAGSFLRNLTDCVGRRSADGYRVRPPDMSSAKKARNTRKIDLVDLVDGSRPQTHPSSGNPQCKQGNHCGYLPSGSSTTVILALLTGPWHHPILARLEPGSVPTPPPFGRRAAPEPGPDRTKTLDDVHRAFHRCGWFCGQFGQGGVAFN
jgi:hypothetical protein